MFFVGKGPSKEIHKEMFPLYGQKCCHIKLCTTGLINSLNGTQNLWETPTWSSWSQLCWDCGRTNSTTSRGEDSRWQVTNDKHYWICNIVFSLQDNACPFEFLKVFARWVPRQLTDEHKNKIQMGLSFTNEWEDMLSRTVSRNESWLHHYQPKSKRDSVEWKHSSLHQPRNWKLHICTKVHMWVRQQPKDFYWIPVGIRAMG